MSHFTVEKATRTRVNIFEASTGNYLCQLTTKELSSWLYRANKARDEEATYAAERRIVRAELARGYLAVRAARAAERGVQLSLFQ